MAKYKVVINSLDNVRELLQEAYNQADSQLIQSQNEISKLANSTNLADEIMESKAKYAKAMNDYLGMKDKAISKKIEIARLLSEICKHMGDVTKSDNENAKAMSFDFSKIREIINQGTSEKKNETIELKKK
jgi:predicted transcriptional regulator